MNTPESLNGIAIELVRRGLPADYAQRTAAELADHHHDLVEELRAGGWTESQAASEASRRLGNSKMLAKKSVREYQSRYWCGRWPLITFLLGPIPLMLISWLAAILGVYCICCPLEKLGIIRQSLPDGTISAGEWLAQKLALVLMGFVMPAVTMYALVQLARRAALTWKWLAVSACVPGLSVGMMRSEFPKPSQHATTMDGKPVPADQGLITLGCPFFASSWRGAFHWYAQDAQQIAQVLLPMVIVAGVSLRARQLSLRSQQLIFGGC